MRIVSIGKWVRIATVGFLSGCLLLTIISYIEAAIRGHGYKYIAEAECIVSPAGELLIPSRVIAYSEDLNYIIALQNPYGCNNADSESSYPYGADYTYFWIIDKQKKNVYGPYNSSEYHRKRRELGMALNFLDVD